MVLSRSRSWMRTAECAGTSECQKVASLARMHRRLVWGLFECVTIRINVDPMLQDRRAHLRNDAVDVGGKNPAADLQTHSLPFCPNQTSDAPSSPPRSYSKAAVSQLNLYVISLCTTCCIIGSFVSQAIFHTGQIQVLSTIQEICSPRTDGPCLSVTPIRQSVRNFRAETDSTALPLRRQRSVTQSFGTLSRISWS